MVDTLKLHAGGSPMARYVSIVSMGLMLVSGCGTVNPHSVTTGTSGSGSPGTASISGGAQLGLIWNAADATLRPLSGVPGSTQMGAPIFPAGTFVAGAYASQTQSALLVDPKGNLELLVLPSLEPQIVRQGIAPSATIAFSPKGAYAVIFAPGATTLATIAGIPQQPVAGKANAGAPIVGASISDAGTLLLASAAAGGAVSVSATAANGTQKTVASLQGFGGMTFVPGSEDILLADSVANTLSRIHNGSAAVLAAHANGLNQPFAVAASQDAHWAVTADRTDAILVRIDLTGATPTAQSTCTCSPSQLGALNGNALFELALPVAGQGSAQGVAPGWMIEADDPVARLLFIPPARGGQ